MGLAVTMLSQKDFERIREIVREEVQAAIKGEATGSFSISVDDKQPCPATKDHLVCVKTAHKGRHTFRPRPHQAPPTKWRTIQQVRIMGAGNRVHLIWPGHPVKVMGLGKRTAKNPQGAAQAGWTVTKIEQSVDDEHNINVVVDKRGENTRTVKIDRIVYARPK
jgi:hypothetical protein